MKTSTPRGASTLLSFALLILNPLTGSTEDTALNGSTAHDRSVAIAVPALPITNILPRQRIAQDLQNPRGLNLLTDATLLVAQAGTGLEDNPNTGSLALLEDTTGDGVFDTRNDILSKLPSKNILEHVRRDEVFGMADVVAGNDTLMVSAAFFGGPSRVYEIHDGAASLWTTVDGNINDLTYSERDRAWIAVSSSSEQLLRISDKHTAQEVLKIPDLPEGQDPVPGYIGYEHATGDVLVSLFSGSPLGEEGGDGTEIIKGAGGVIRVNTSDGSFEWVVSGLTAPTDIALDARGRLYILEFCSDFLDPITGREEMHSDAVHGGFKRFSGRLLRIDLHSAEVELLAAELDGPTNLHLTEDAIFISQGMGTPGRLIPRGATEIPLTGFIDKVLLD